MHMCMQHTDSIEINGNLRLYSVANGNLSSFLSGWLCQVCEWQGRTQDQSLSQQTSDTNLPLSSTAKSRRRQTNQETIYQTADKNFKPKLYYMHLHGHRVKVYSFKL